MPNLTPDELVKIVAKEIEDDYRARHSDGETIKIKSHIPFAWAEIAIRTVLAEIEKGNVCTIIQSGGVSTQKIALKSGFQKFMEDK